MRTSFQQLFTQLIETLPDNDTGEISPADVRNMFGQLFETIQPGYAVMQITEPRLIQTKAQQKTVITNWDRTLFITEDFVSDEANGIIREIARGVCEISGLASMEFTNNTVDLTINSSVSEFDYPSTIASAQRGRITTGSVGGVYDVFTEEHDFTLTLKPNDLDENIVLTYALFFCRYIPLRVEE